MRRTRILLILALLLFVSARQPGAADGGHLPQCDLQPGGDRDSGRGYADFETSVSRSDAGYYDQSNDYSYNAANYKGALIYGTEP